MKYCILTFTYFDNEYSKTNSQNKIYLDIEKKKFFQKIQIRK